LTDISQRGTRRCRIGFVSDGVYPFNKGGKERRLWEITRRLQENGVDVHIYTMKWWTGPTTLDLDGIRLHAICKQRSLYQGERRSIIQALMFGLSTLKLIVARFDVLDVDHMPYFPLFAARIVCMLRRKRMVATWHEVWGNEYWRSYLGRLALISIVIEWLAARSAHEIIAVSAQTSSRLIEELKVKVPVRTIELGVDLTTIQLENRSALESDILYAGRLLSHKNVDMLLRAVALLKEDRPWLHCRIIGEGPERSRLESLALELDLEKNVSFHDFFPGSAIYGIMKSATVFALPSVREGFGVVVLEANSCGLPVITINHHNNAARHLIIQDQNGFLAEADAGSLAKALDTALIRAPSLDPRASAERGGHLRDWGEVAAAYFHAVTDGQFPRPVAHADS
jgi:glycosyltransferase involved in cell wall biosynthesis